MNYRALALKWRPQSFSEVVGQLPVLELLSHALTNNCVHHAYLFTGTRGVGKTTLARLLAKSLNCAGGVSNKPCNACNICIGITQGKCADVIEIDAASKTKVEETRALLENVGYAAIEARYKIYIIDEVHMLSTHSFNALLKTLEEPPRHVKFLLATTEPHKCPDTVLSRCLHCKLASLSVMEIGEQIEKILKLENISYDPNAILPLASAARGSMRDALSLLEQVVGSSGGRLIAEAVMQVTGINLDGNLYKLLHYVQQRDVKAVRNIITELQQQSVDFAKALHRLQVILNQVSWAHLLQEGLDKPTVILSEQIDALQVQIYYQACLAGLRDLAYVADSQSVFEMAILRMLAYLPRQVYDADLLVEQQAHSQGTDLTCKQEGDPKGEVNWNNMVTRLDLSGLAKVLVQNCIVLTWQLPNIVLGLHNVHKSLCQPKYQDKIAQALSSLLQQNVKLTVKLLADTEVQQQTPIENIMQKQRENLNAAKQAIQQDANVQYLLQEFDVKIQQIDVCGSS